MTFQDIIAVTSDELGISLEDIVGPKRDFNTTLARHIAIYLLMQNTPMKLWEIGALLGNRTPATISHGYQRIAKLVSGG